MINKNRIIQKNLDLLNEFMKYAFEHPEILDKIPPEAELVILPTNDPELFAVNKKMAASIVKKGKKVVAVEFKKPRTIIEKIELMKSK
jgi:glutamyl-tRNA reductase